MSNSAVSMAHTAPVPSSVLEGLDRDVYHWGDIEPPEGPLTSGSRYADHVPRGFMPLEAKLKRNVVGEEASITVQVRLNAGPATLFTSPITLTGEVTTVPLSAFAEAVRNNGLAVDTRLTVLFVVTPGAYGSPVSKGLRIDLTGQWKAT